MHDRLFFTKISFACWPHCVFSSTEGWWNFYSTTVTPWFNKGALKKTPTAAKKNLFCGCWCNFFNAPLFNSTTTYTSQLHELRVASWTGGCWKNYTNSPINCKPRVAAGRGDHGEFDCLTLPGWGIWPQASEVGGAHWPSSVCTVICVCSPIIADTMNWAVQTYRTFSAPGWGCLTMPFPLSLGWIFRMDLTPTLVKSPPSPPGGGGGRGVHIRPALKSA